MELKPKYFAGKTFLANVTWNFYLAWCGGPIIFSREYHRVALGLITVSDSLHDLYNTWFAAKQKDAA